MEMEQSPDPSFLELAERRKYKVIPASREQVESGIDFVVKGVYRSTNKEVTMLFSVKRKKTKKKSRYLDRWTWIEYKNSFSKDGWIYGPAHFIAFERSKDFIIVSRKALLDFLTSSKCKVKWDLPFVKEPKDAKYRVYQNNNTGCQISQILSKDLLKLEGAQIWKKECPQL